MKSYVFLAALLMLVINLSCSSSTGDPFYEGIKVTTDPGNASVFIDNNYYGSTPLSIEKSTGTYNLTIKRTGYIEYKASISIPKNDYLDLKTITLAKNDSIVKIFGPILAGIQINGDTSALCAIDISEGKTVSINDPNADFYFSYNKASKTLEIKNLSGEKAKKSYFYKTENPNWYSGNSAPEFGTNKANWETAISNVGSNCFYVYDSDGKYSMFQINNDSDPSSGVVVLKYAYNKFGKISF